MISGRGAHTDSVCCVNPHNIVSGNINQW